jgi:hypothetical protein
MLAEPHNKPFVDSVVRGDKEPESTYNRKDPERKKKRIENTEQGTSPSAGPATEKAKNADVKGNDNVKKKRKKAKNADAKGNDDIKKKRKKAKNADAKGNDNIKKKRKKP